MLDGKPIQSLDQLLCAPMKLLQCRTFDLVLAANLLHQQLGIANNLQCFAAVLQRILQSGQQPVVLGIVIGLPAKIFTERGNLVSRSEEHTSELQSLRQLVCRLQLEKKIARETGSFLRSLS